jgi:DNA repair protein RadA/Sms
MPRKSYFLCSECGYKSGKWLGKCPECGNWNTFVEETENEKPGSAGSARSPGTSQPAAPLSEVSASESERLFSGEPELDRVLGGIVPGQAVLIAGEPGIGKSTLVLALAARLSVHFGSKGSKVHYVNGEESNGQVKLRADRLGIGSSPLLLAGSSDLETVIERLKREKPAAIVVDSIQTIQSASFDSLPGSIVQVRECTYALVEACKAQGAVLFLVGHVTRSGNIAGPKVVEHIVDTVLTLETDARGYYRILRSQKNRFHSTDEAGYFTMEEHGLTGVADLSRAFTVGRDEETSGVAVYPMLEGSRVFPVEVQALCVPTEFNYPKRTADGFDQNRLAMLAAVMEKRIEARLSGFDIYLNVTGGLRVQDPALDLAVIFAVYSAAYDKPLPKGCAVFGETGLTGEVRPVNRSPKRIAEMARLGATTLVYPHEDGAKIVQPGCRLLPVRSLREAVTAALGK